MALVGVVAFAIGPCGPAGDLAGADAVARRARDLLDVLEAARRTAAAVGGVRRRPERGRLAYVQHGEFFPLLVARYGLSFVPWTMACLGFVATRRGLLRPLVALAGVGSVVMLLAVSGTWGLVSPWP